MNFMFHRLPILTMLAGALATASVAAHAEERLLILDSDVLVVVDWEVPCGQRVPLTVRTSDRGLFSQDNPRLQNIIDGSRAILAFECARMPALEVTGELNATKETIFQGHAGDETGWLIHSSQWQAATPVREPETAGLPEWRVAGLTMGMTHDEVRSMLASEFKGAEPTDNGSNRLVAGDRECLNALASTTQTRPGQRCLIADFDRAEQHRLVHVILHQAVDGDQRQDIRESLLERYGQPVAESSGKVQASGSPFREFVRLSWGDALRKSTRPAGWPAEFDNNRYALAAYIASNRNKTILTVWMADPSMTADAPEYRAKF